MISVDGKAVRCIEHAPITREYDFKRLAQAFAGDVQISSAGVKIRDVTHHSAADIAARLSA
jgi:hypothetical protein